MLIYVLRWRPSWISDRHKKHKICRGPSNDHSWAVQVFYADRKYKIAASAGNRLTLDLMGKCSNAFSETTNMIKAKLYMNEISANQSILLALAAMLNIRLERKTKICIGPSNEHSCLVWIQSDL
jgi:hypothetical protein